MTSGKQWPVGIIISTLLIITACVVSIYVAFLQPVQQDTDMMMDYRTLDMNANEVIVAGLIFNKKYTLTYTGEGVSEEGSTLSYKLTDKEGNPINSAIFEVVLSRPVISGSEIVLKAPGVQEGNYIFEDVKVTKKGRWNILTKVSVGDDFRHMNLKSSTLDKDVYEYGLDKPMRNFEANN